MTEAKPAETTPKKDHGVLYIGMDLGTSRTSVSASNGVRETVYSMVGYPKDVVSQKLLKKDVLFGKEALDKRLSLKLYKPLEKGVLKYTGDAAKDAELRCRARWACLCGHRIALCGGGAEHARFR
mgnify:CR=1 FL=1